MFNKLFKKVISLAMAFAVVLSLSCCGMGDEVRIDETPTETTSEAAEATSEKMTEEATTSETTQEEITISETTEETTETLSKEELDALAKNMPEIVFVLSYQVFHENIFGYYVTNTGEVKMFDFREIAPDEIYEIYDVYDRLEEVTYDGLYFRKHGEVLGKKKISEDDLNTLSEEKLIEYYKRLLLIEGDAEYIKWDTILTDGRGDYKFYGIKGIDNGTKECILLCGDGAGSEYKHSNTDARDMYRDFRRIFPDLRGRDWH
ncbi:MAG: hypothetical protein J1F11_08600 [Oscillospiraceae bacterium]|nr:hypothetical protein [Oscillospiraceae bacterium]